VLTPALEIKKTVPRAFKEWQHHGAGGQNAPTKKLPAAQAFSNSNSMAQKRLFDHEGKNKNTFSRIAFQHTLKSLLRGNMPRGDPDKGRLARECPAKHVKENGTRAGCLGRTRLRMGLCFEVQHQGLLKIFFLTGNRAMVSLRSGTGRLAYWCEKRNSPKTEIEPRSTRGL